MSDMFGVLPKGHKWKFKYKWKSRGLITDDFDAIYDRYINSTNCEKCGNEYKNRRDKQMDHSHNTGEFRNMLCLKCNHITDRQAQKNNTSGHVNIHSRFDKTTNKYYWVIITQINGKTYSFRRAKHIWTLEEVVAQRDAMLEDLGIFRETTESLN